MEEMMKKSPTETDKRKMATFKWIFRNKLKAILCANSNRGTRHTHKHTLEPKQVNNNSNYGQFILATVECVPRVNIRFKVFDYPHGRWHFQRCEEID